MVQTLVVGIDAATPMLLDRFRREGVTPRLAELFKKGASGRVDSTRPPMTPQAWTSIATGVNPGKHGIFDFRTQNRDSYEVSPIDYHEELSYPTLWDHFVERDISVGVVNYPLAHPPHEVNGFFVSGIPAATEEGIAHPNSVQSYLENRNYQVSPQKDPNDNKIAYFNELCDLLNERCEVTLDLADRHNPEILWTVFMAIDWAQHYLWNIEIKGVDAVQQLYQQVDRHIDRLLNHLDPDCVIIMSDHGMTPIDHEIYLNDLLVEWDYLQINEDKINAALHQRIGGIAWRLGKQIFGRNAKDKIKSILPNTLVQSARDGSGTIRQGRLDDVIDWSSTTAFTYGSMGRLFVHDVESYPSGTVSSQEYRAFIDELTTALMDLRDPEGRQVFKEVISADQTCGTNQDTEGPDLLLEPRDWSYMIYGELTGQPFHDTDKRLADHHPTGIIAFEGEGVMKTDGLDCHVTDIAPTLLYLCDLPILDSMDGTIIKEAIDTSNTSVDPKVVSQVDVTKQSTDTKHGDESIEDRLEDLGYL